MTDGSDLLHQWIKGYGKADINLEQAITLRNHSYPQMQETALQDSKVPITGGCPCLDNYAVGVGWIRD